MTNQYNKSDARPTALDGTMDGIHQNLVMQEPLASNGRSTVATPPGFHRPTNRRHATQQKEKPHSRHAPHRRLVLIWD
ncbi:hypothetical protein TNCV_2972361 [Trichonephila clavipes]|nr:hypothetical protein TNCV_2972361 [Trichonephila clavipes]